MTEVEYNIVNIQIINIYYTQYRQLSIVLDTFYTYSDEIVSYFGIISMALMLLISQKN